jgi:hypothetical protein
MSFRKIKPISVHANSQKNLVLRQQFALKLINAMQAGKTILNIDQSWLGMSDFRRMKWRTKASTNSVPKLQLAPRITIIAGIDSKGNIYLSLLQANTNNQTLAIFLRQLCSKLDKETRDWRDHYLCVLDNASYHTSSATIRLFEQLRVPVCFTGPHSYDACPAELLFAAFKSRDINPRHVPAGKGHFLEVTRLVLDRMLEIPLHHRILFWHHCLKELYRYLSFPLL